MTTTSNTKTNTKLARNTVLAALMLSTGALSGCAQIGSAADSLWGGTKSAARWVSTPVRHMLRGAPEQTVEYAYADPYSDSYAETSSWEGGEVVLYTDAGVDYAAPYASTTSEPIFVPSYNAQPSYAPQPSYSEPSYSEPSYATYDSGQFYSGEAPVQTAEIESADSLAFVKLNGESDMNDWRFCETVHRGYWKVDAAGGRINPDFEVCLRNKGYVQESELAMYGLNGETPLRGSQASRGYVGGYAPLP